MPPTDDQLGWKRRIVVDLHGHRIGRILDVEFKPETDAAEWACITVGRLGLRRRFVPLGDAELLAGQGCPSPSTPSRNYARLPSPTC